MPVPIVIIRSQSRSDKTITVTGVVRNGATSIKIDLPASAIPNGAVSRPQADVLLNAAGEFTHNFPLCPYGDYAPATVTATNGSGSHTASTWPMTLFVPGTAPVGTPRTLLPAFAAPTFDAPTVALGGAVTDIVLESTSGTAQTNVPFTFGQPFKSGDLAPGDYLVGKIAGQADIPLQFNVKATHPNGSVRHAIISGVLPNLPAGASKTVQMVRVTSGTSTTAAPSSAISAAGLTAAINITVGGVAYSANATAALAAGDGMKLWIGGVLVNEYIVNLPFKAADGALHPDLTAQFCVRHYPGAAKAKVDVAVEHTKAYTAVANVAYSGSVSIGGSQAMVIAALDGADLVHAPATRWKRTFWWNHASPVHVKQNVAYLIGSRAVSNYDRSVVFPESKLTEYEAALSTVAFHLLGNGLFAKAFGGTGARPELGLASEWYVTALLTQDKRAKKLMLALGECAGSWGVHRRDTSGGPASGAPIDIIHFPRVTTLGTSGDSKNTASGQFEKLPALPTSTFKPDTSHQSAFAYIPYLVSGDYYYLEELHFWSSFNNYLLNPGSVYRNSQYGEIKADQLRGQAWTLRTMAHCAAITPDDDPSKPRHQFWLQNNLSWFNATYTDNPDANKLGVIINGATVVYNTDDPATPEAEVDNATANYQEDFFTQATGHVAEQGFADAARLAYWNAKWPVQRMIGEGACYTHATEYTMKIRDTATSAVYDTIAQVFQKTFPPELNALACGSQARLDYMNANRALPSNPYQPFDMVGYPSGNSGAVADMQPALAYAVDVGYPDADVAQLLFNKATTKPNYAQGAQFAIVPRGYTPPEVIDPPVDPVDPVDPAYPVEITPPLDSYTIVINLTLHIGRAPD